MRKVYWNVLTAGVLTGSKTESRAKPTPSWIPVTFTLGQTANVKTFVQQETKQLISKQRLNNSCLAVTV